MSSSSEGSNPLPFSLDAKVPAREVSFLVLRDVIAWLAQEQPSTYASIVERPAPPLQGLLSKDDGSPMSRTYRYHHLNALKILGLVERGPQGYSLTDTGRAVANAPPGAEGGPLSPGAKLAFQAAVRSCDLARRNLFVLFTGDPRADPWGTGTPVSMHPIPGRRTYEVRSPRWLGALRLSTEQTHGIIWGLRRWCLSLGMIDEIFIRPQADVAPEQANIIFPVRTDGERVSLDRFAKALQWHLGSVRPVFGDTIAISIPLLFYRLCPAEQLSLRDAKDLLTRWLASNRPYAFVEAPSYTVLEAGRFRRGASREAWRKQQETFLPIEGRVYSRLLVSRALWQTKGAAPSCQ